MQKNVGGYDRIARFVLGPILVVLGGATLTGFVTLATGTVGLALGAVLLLVGAVFIVTATTRKCPLNSVLGLNTYKDSATERPPSEDAKASAK